MHIIMFYLHFWVGWCAYDNITCSLLWLVFAHVVLIFAQRVKDEVLKRRLQCSGSHEKQEDGPKRLKPSDHEEFQAALNAAKTVAAQSIKECKWDLHSSPGALEQPIHNGQRILLLNPVCEEPISSVDSEPWMKSVGLFHTLWIFC